MDVDAAGERYEYDPSEASYEGAYLGAFQDYVHRELKRSTDMYYAVSGNVRPWDQTGNTEVAEVLRAARTQQTHLKVLVVCATTTWRCLFNGIDQTVSRMSLEPSVHKNIAFTYYECGRLNQRQLPALTFQRG